MKIKELHIAFENCEVLSIPIEMIQWFIQRGITNSHYISHDKKLSGHLTAEETTLVIKGDIDSLGLWLEEDRKPSNRIKDKDITLITIKYEDDSESRCYVKWEGDNDYYNPAQNVKFDGEFITIEIK